MALIGKSDEYLLRLEDNFFNRLKYVFRSCNVDLSYI
jgi:hypothetical protein